jgi:hypothetical protein
MNVVMNTFRPPLSGDALLARRCMTRAQSVVCRSTYMPQRCIMSTAIFAVTLTRG